MSNDISHLPDYPGKEELQKALTLRAKVEALVEHSKPLLEAKRPELRGRRISQQPFDPERTLLNKYQGNLYHASQIDGIYGLARIVTDHVERHFDETQGSGKSADEKSKKKPPHRHIIEDFANGHKRMCWLILSMHKDVLESLIRGNLISREYEEPEFKARTSKSTILHPAPSIYLLQIVNAEYFEGSRQKYPGRGLNWREWKATLHALAQYLEESENGQNAAGGWVDRVDGSFIDRSREPWQRGQNCRYLANSRQKEVLREFIAAAQKMYVEKGQALADVDLADPALDVPMARVPQECGWGRYGIDRSAAHGSGGQFSNSLFNLFHCVLRELWGRTRWEVMKRKLVDVTRPSDAPLAEYFCSELGQTYWYQAGPARALETFQSHPIADRLNISDPRRWLADCHPVLSCSKLNCPPRNSDFSESVELQSRGANNFLRSMNSLTQ